LIAIGALGRERLSAYHRSHADEARTVYSLVERELSGRCRIVAAMPRGCMRGPGTGDRARHASGGARLGSQPVMNEARRRRVLMSVASSGDTPSA
jgi:hypothetical protein